MSQVPAWFERRFTFDFPVEQFPNLLSRLRGSPARLEEVSRSLSQGQRMWRQESKWSAQEEAGHLLDMEPLWLARVEDFLGGGDTLTPADLTNRRTHEANHNARELADLLQEFRAARLRLVERLEELPVENFTRTLIHPRLQQPMRLVDHLYFVAEHDDHHLATIRALREGF